MNNKDELTAVTYYATKQIDLQKVHKEAKPHTHHGYEHNESDSAKGASKLTTGERKMIDRIYKI